MTKAPRTRTFQIRRLPGAAARRNVFTAPMPRLMGTIEAANEHDALDAFARAEAVRSSQVSGYRLENVKHPGLPRKEAQLTITLRNGAKAVHEATYVAWRS